MPKRSVEIFTDGTEVFFDKGKFDDWCVYLTDTRGGRKPPLDTEYFSFFQRVSDSHGRAKVYADFTSIYDLTTEAIDPLVLKNIERLSLEYLDEVKLDVQKNFVVIYAGMIAEENKERAILKKKIKKIGFYQAVVSKMPAEEAANFSKGKPWRELDDLYKRMQSGKL